MFTGKLLIWKLPPALKEYAPPIRPEIVAFAGDELKRGQLSAQRCSELSVLAGHLRDRRSVQHLEHRPVAMLGRPPPVVHRLRLTRFRHKDQRAPVVQDVPRPSKVP
ncbi:hypothetical protein [Streptomyces pseudoechinosporeus]